MKKLILWTGLLLSAAPAAAQTEVLTGVTRGKDFGVTYTLPKTQLEIEVKAIQATYTPGEFSKYADRYLRLKEVSTSPDTYWELVSTTVKAIGVPDSEQVYFVKMKDRTVAPLIELTEEGIIQSINMPFTAKKAVTATTTSPVKKKINARDFLTEEILMANSSAKMAELIAKEIYSIRESRSTLVRGEAENMPKDGEQLKLMLNSLEEQEQALTELFSGVRQKEEKRFTFRLDPSKELQDEVVLRFSKWLGVVANNDLSGEPIYITLKQIKTLNLPPEDGKKKVDGIAYNVPGRGLVTVTTGQTKLFEGEIPITQFGTTEFLAPALFNKKATTKVSFNPTTGGLIKVDREEEN